LIFEIGTWLGLPSLEYVYLFTEGRERERANDNNSKRKLTTKMKYTITQTH
jgi:hypothetical protein